MNENKEKREFAQQLEQIAETLTQAVKDNEGRAFILIGIKAEKKATTKKTAIYRA